MNTMKPSYFNRLQSEHNYRNLKGDHVPENRQFYDPYGYFGKGGIHEAARFWLGKEKFHNFEVNFKHTQNLRTIGKSIGEYATKYYDSTMVSGFIETMDFWLKNSSAIRVAKPDTQSTRAETSRKTTEEGTENPTVAMWHIKREMVGWYLKAEDMMLKKKALAAARQ